MTSEPRYLEFDLAHLDEVVATMQALTEAHIGWINFEPSVDIDDVPPAGNGFFAIFSGRGPDVPLATWTPPATPRRERGEPVMIGLQHGVGGRVKSRLADRGHPVPDGWVVLQDYAKKGLVVAVPPAVPHGDVLTWLLAAARVVSTIPVEETWRASIYDG
jgi:hypothetical protein